MTGKKKKAIKIFFKTLIRTIEVTLALSFVLFQLAVWRLWKDPVDFKNFAPTIVNAIVPKDANMTVEVDSAFLQLGLKRGNLLEVNVQNLTVLDANDVVVAQVPETSISLSLWSLLGGHFVPTSIHLQRPFVNIDSIPKETPAQDKNFKPIEGLRQTMRQLRKLETVNIQAGEFIFHVADEQFLIPDLNVTMDRLTDHQLEVKASFSLYTQGTFMPFWVSGVYDSKTRHFLFDATFKELQLQKLVAIDPLLKGLRLTLNGSLAGELDLSGRDKTIPRLVKGATFSASLANDGSVYLPDPLDIVYEIKNMTLKGSISQGLKQVDVSEGFIDIYGPVANARVTITGLDAYLNTDDVSNVKTTLTATVQGVPVSQVPSVWPETLGPDAHEWVRQNITHGDVTDALFVLKFSGNNLDEVKGLLDVKDATVRYIETMPVARHVNGKVILQLGRVDIEADAGDVGNIQLEKAVLHLTELLGDNPLADINITATAPVNEALTLINFQPLELAAMFGLDPLQTKGQGRAQVNLHFPLDEDIDTKDVIVQASATLYNTATSVPGTPFTFKNGSLRLDVNNDRMIVEGTGTLDNSDVSLIWQENFNNTSEFQSRYLLAGTVADADISAYAPVLAPYINGHADASATITVQSNQDSVIEVQAHLDQMLLRMTPLSYTKKMDQKADLSGRLVFKKGTLSKIDRVKFLTEDKKVSIEGRALFGKKDLYELTKIRAPKSNLSASYLVNGDMKSLTLTGQSFNLSGFQSLSDKGPGVEDSAPHVPLSYQLMVHLDRLYLAPKEAPLTSVSIDLLKEKDIWKTFDARATAMEELTMNLNPKTNVLTIRSEDVGHFLKQAGISDRIKGGLLRASLRQNETGILTGNLIVKKFALTEVGFLMKAATVLGIIDGITNNTIQFNRATLPVSLFPDHVVSVEDGVLSGTTLGLTAKGFLSISDIDLSGTIIPAYAVNSLPGRIPLVGTLFSGEKGGGLFGLPYELFGPPNNLEYNLKPSNLLAPGIIRNIFN